MKSMLGLSAAPKTDETKARQSKWAM